MRCFGGIKARLQILFALFIHQESDRSQIHPEDRFAAAEKSMQRLQHESVATQCHDDVSVFGRDIAVKLPQPGQSFLRLRSL